LSDGGFVVAWMSQHAFGQGGNIMAQRFDAAGTKVGGELTVTTTEPLDQQAPAIEAFADGRFIVTWTQAGNNNTNPFNDYDIYARLYTAAGSPAGNPIQLSTAAAPSFQINSDVATFADGSAVVVWQSLNQDGSGWGVVGRRIDASGAAVGNEFIINTTTANDQFGVTVTALGPDPVTDGFVAVWVSENQDSASSFGIFGQRYAFDTGTNAFVKVGLEFPVNQDLPGIDPAANNQTAPSVTLLSDDTFVVSWQGVNTTADVMARTFSFAGTTPAPVHDAVRLNASTTGDQGNTFTPLNGVGGFGFETWYGGRDSIEQLSNGNLAVVWYGAPNNDAFTRVIPTGLAAANNDPLATDDSFTVAEDSGATVLDVRANDTLNGDVGETLTIEAVTQPTGAAGTVTFTGTNVTFTPAPNFFGTTTFTYRINDGNSGTDTATVTVDVTPDNNDAPRLTATDRNPTFGTEFGQTRSPADLFSLVSASTEGGDLIDELKLTVTNVVNGADEKLIIDGTSIALVNTGTPITTANGSIVTVSLTGTTATVTITDSGLTAAELTALVEALAYDNTNVNPGPARRLITITSVSDTNGTAGSDTRPLSISSFASPPGVNELISVSTDGIQGDLNSQTRSDAPFTDSNAHTYNSVSADGRYVTFQSSATTLVPGDTNLNINGAGQDIFLRDRFTGETIRVSVADDESQGTNPNLNDQFAAGASISADGNRIAFTAGFSNLVAGDTNFTRDIFVRDVAAETTTRVSIGVGDVQGVGGAAEAAEISADGQVVAFQTSFANLLGSGVDSNGLVDVYVRNMATNTTTRVSVADDESQATGGVSSAAALSSDGNIVAFQSLATNLIGAGIDTNSLSDIFVRNMLAGTTTRVSVSDTEAQAIGGGSISASISADGNRVAFQSSATNLVTGDSNGQSDIFVRDIAAETTIRVSVNTSGAQFGSASVAPSISADGNRVAFANNNQIFVHDISLNQTFRVGLPFTSGQDSSAFPVISADGKTIIFQSGSVNVVPYDTNPISTQDVFATTVETLVLGGTIWNDNGDSGGIAGNGTKEANEPGVNGVVVTLFADANNDNVADNLSAPLATATTAGGGHYTFAGLAPGHYVVRVDQSNFNAGGALQTLQTSPITTPDEPPDPDNNVDHDDNGARTTGQPASLTGSVP
jgi:Bacterial Ig domain/SdrD B-like domain/WD40-like Beta Propeller Repeat